MSSELHSASLQFETLMDALEEFESEQASSSPETIFDLVDHAMLCLFLYRSHHNWDDEKKEEVEPFLKPIVPYLSVYVEGIMKEKADNSIVDALIVRSALQYIQDDFPHITVDVQNAISDERTKLDECLVIWEKDPSFHVPTQVVYAFAPGQLRRFPADHSWWASAFREMAQANTFRTVFGAIYKR